MKPIEGYEQAPAYTGEVMVLPAGLYKCVIKQVNVVEDSKRREQMVICFDIVEGTQKDGYQSATAEYKGFYEKQFQARKQADPSVKWGGIIRQLTHGDSLPFFKGIMTSVEKSNPGYRWDWNERGLVGKYFGGIFQREEFLTGDGQKKMATKCIQVRSLEGLKDAKVPMDKLLEESAGGNQGQNGRPSPADAAPPSFTDGFVNIPEGAGDEGVPFM